MYLASTTLWFFGGSSFGMEHVADVQNSYKQTISGVPKHF